MALHVCVCVYARAHVYMCITYRVFLLTIANMQTTIPPLIVSKDAIRITTSTWSLVLVSNIINFPQRGKHSPQKSSNCSWQVITVSFPELAFSITMSLTGVTSDLKFSQSGRNDANPSDFAKFHSVVQISSRTLMQVGWVITIATPLLSQGG